MRLVRAAIILAAATLVTLASCDVTTTDPFPEYRGVNLLEAWGRGAGANWINDPDSDWRIDYGSPVVTVDYDYIEVTTPAGQTGPSGVSNADASVRLVEIPNLYPNGDFQTGTVGDLPPGWSALNGASGQLVESPSGRIIDGRTFAHDVTAEDFSRVTFDLRDTDFGILDGWPADALYGFRFDFNVADLVTEFLVEYNDNVDGTAGTIHSLGQDMAVGIPVADAEYLERSYPGEVGEENLLTVPSEPTGHHFSIGTITDRGDRIVGHIDNLRFYRADIKPSVELDIPLSAATEDLPFQLGTYRFSIWVKAAPDSLVTPATANAFRARLFSVMAETRTSLGGTRRDYTLEAAAEDNGFVFSTDTGEPDEWRQVSVDFFLEALPPSDADVVMTLGFSPDHLIETVETGRDIGRILVAAPELIFDPQN